ncbi:MAG: BON domain-containing protein [Aquabacterium sp.]
MNSRSKHIALFATSLVAALALSACNRHHDTETAGQKLDRNIAEARQEGQDAKQSAQQMGQEAKTNVEQAAKKAGDDVNDATITAAVKAKLAADSQLSALDIQVQTDHGDVLLTGKAPSDTARAHATTLASSVSGVQAVQNHLLLDGDKL